jgi:hypothetical protein
MKMKKAILYFACLSLFFVVGCREQDMLEMEHYIKQVYLVGSGEEGHMLTRKVNFAQAEVDITTSVYVSGSLLPDRDVVVELEEDPAAIDEYNKKYKSENDIQYAPMPNDLYKFESMRVVIPAGHAQTLVPVKITTSGLHCDSLYTIPLKIKSCSEYQLMEPNITVLLSVSTYNTYSGNYNYEGEKDGIPFSLLRTAVAVNSNTIRIYNSGAENIANVDDEGVTFSINENNTLTIKGWKNMEILESEGTYDAEEETFTVNFRYKDSAGAEHSVSGKLILASLDHAEE